MRDREKSGRLKRFFVRGLAVLVPMMITVWIFIWTYHLIQKTMGWLINKGIVLLLMKIEGIPFSDEPTREQMEQFWVHGWGSLSGFIIALMIVFAVGIVLASVIGKLLWRRTEELIENMPLVKRVYPYVKQVSDFLLSQDEKTRFFTKVVAVEYPRKGIWSIGFVTGGGIRRVVNGQETELLSVMLPTSPSPVTGFVVLVPKEETITLDMTVEEALRYIISAGVITPKAIIDEAKRGK
jgi:uncharacterized membrane protein